MGCEYKVTVAMLLITNLIFSFFTSLLIFSLTLFFIITCLLFSQIVYSFFPPLDYLSAQQSSLQQLCLILLSSKTNATSVSTHIVGLSSSHCYS